MNAYLLSLILGIVEGLTEFIPVSSTAHLRIAEFLLHINLSDGYWKMYTIVIQLGAILCLPVYFRERIAKFLARAGCCSRRDAERWIADGRVSVDGSVLTTPAATVTTASQIRVDCRPVGAPDRPRLWRYHKPKGLVTTHRDERGRRTVFAALPSGLPRLISLLPIVLAGMRNSI